MSAPTPYKRELRPAHYIMKIESFSTVSKLHKYESRVFEAGGYKWSLSLYPNGDKHTKGSGYISLYLSIEETSNFPPDWKVHVNYKLFVHDKIRDDYLTIQDADGTVRTFNDKKTQWGFSQFLSLETFQKDSNGYLLHGFCAFGAEVFVLNSTGKEESLTIIKDPPNQRFTWKMKNFSKLDKDPRSYAFSFGQSKWKLSVYTKGNVPTERKSLSMKLQVQDLPPKRKVYAEFYLRVRNQFNGNHKEEKASHWLSASSPKVYDDFMPMEDLQKRDNVFVKNDVLIVEVQFLVISAVKALGL
ncbi:hypothetical protein NL676_011889 [Syzygium grande]|nr:hypothetical protein NL676_011889 [Syzygium grande]